MDNTIDIYKEIGEATDFWTGENTLFSFKNLVSELKELEPNSNVKFRINSFGGSVLDGLSIFNAIKGHSGDTTAEIVGYAMSISSIIPLACNTVKMASNAWIVIHEARINSLWGDFESQDLTNLADVIEGHNKNIAKIYAAKMKISKSAAREMMKGETWITAQEAKKMGLIDEIIEGVDVTASVNPDSFQNMPESVKNSIVNRKGFQMEGKNILMAFGLSDDEIKAGDLTKITNAMASLTKLGDVEARMTEIESTQNATVETLEKSIEAKVTESEDALNAKISALETANETLVASNEALTESNEALKTSVANQDTAIVEGLAAVKGDISTFENSLNDQSFQTKLEEVKLSIAVNK